MEELKNCYKTLLLRTYVECIMNMLPIFASIVIFGVYSALNGQENLTSAKVFTVLSIFNLIATPMRLLIMTVITFMNAKASLERVDHFFGYEDKSTEGVNTNDTDLEVGEIEFKESFFQWENNKVKKHHEEGEKLKARGKDGKKPNKDGDKKDKKPEGEKKKKKKKKVVDGEEPKKKKKKSKKKKRMSDTEESLKESLLSASSESERSSISASNLDLASLDLGTLRIGRGEFVSVIGRVGSGKSTLLAAILGEIDKVRGTLSRRGSVAYIPQISWLRSATIRENITFETPYDEARYNHIIKVCEL